MQDLKILILQTDICWEAPYENRKKLEQKIIYEFNSHDLILLPETFTTGFPVDPDKFHESLDGESVGWMKKISQKLKTTVAGSLLLKSKDKYANTFVWVMPDGSYYTYEKRHVFSMGGEHKKITAGKSKPIITINGWKILPQICYDLRFPVWSKNTFSDKGFAYDIAIYTANWPAVRSLPWKALLVARAIENQSFVIGVNRVGIDNLGNKYSGDSMIVDAKGRIIKQGAEFKEETISVILSKKELIDFRKNFNVGNDWDKFEITG